MASVAGSDGRVGDDDEEASALSAEPWPPSQLQTLMKIMATTQRDLVKMKTLNIDPNKKQTLEEQKATVEMLQKLSHASAAVTCWAWATESYTSPNCFIRILADKWSDAESGMEWVRTTFEPCVQAQRHVDEQQLDDNLGYGWYEQSQWDVAVSGHES